MNTRDENCALQLMEAVFGPEQVPATERLRILLIEDDGIDRMALRRYVIEQGLAYDLTEAVALQEARQRLADRRYDVILLDNGLPDGSGYELLKEAGETPVVFVTGANELGMAVRAVREGAADYLVKDSERSYLRMLPLIIARAVGERRTRTMLLRSQQLCHQVFAEAPLGKIVATVEGAVLKSNQATCTLFGHEPAELVRAGLGLVLHTVDFRRFKEALGLLVASPQLRLTLEMPAQHKSGGNLQLRLHISVVRQNDGRPLVSVVQFEDITEFRRMERAVRASEERMRHLIDSVPAAVFASDAEGLITYFNPQTELLWGRRPKLGDPADRFFRSFRLFGSDGISLPPERCWMAVAMAERRVVTAEGMQIEIRPGYRRHVLAYSSPMMDSSGELVGAINVLVDVTDLKRLEDYRRTLEAQLSQARKLEAIGTLAGGVAHEFNNLLAAIMGNLQLAESEMLPEQLSAPFLSEALMSCRRARDLVERLLVFSQQAEGPKTAIHLDGIVANAELMLGPILPAGVFLNTRSNPTCPPILGNGEELVDAIVQLGVNAVHAMGEGGGLLEITHRHSVPAPELRDRHPQVKANHTVCLTLRDTGAGMSATTVEKAFEPFYTTKPPGRGSGLGLAGAFGVMKRHRGAIVVESTEGIGTTVRLFFPAAD